MKRIRLGSVFSGIGGIEQAFTKLGLPYEIVFACDNGERELDKPFAQLALETKDMSPAERNAYIKREYQKTRKPNYVKQSYFANYEIEEEQWFEDIRFLDGNNYAGKVDLFVGGSPCQSFSIMGKRYGLEDTRGTLFYEYARLIKEIGPKAFIYENVPGMLMHDKGHTWSVISQVFQSLGYEIRWKILNSKDYGIPQDRRRLFVVGVKNKEAHFSFPEPIELKSVAKDYFEARPIPAKHYLGKKGFEFVTNPKYKNRARVNPDIIQTEKANQQFNWNGDFVFEPLAQVRFRPDVMARAYVGYWSGQRGVIRQMTHRECLRLMGFPDSFKIVVPNVPAYRQAGNAIVVDVIAAVLRELVKSGAFE